MNQMLARRPFNFNGHFKKYQFTVLSLLVAGLFALGYILSPMVLERFDRAQPARQSGLQTPGASGIATVDPPYRLQDFTLTSHTNEPVSLSDFRGSPVLLFFGYTNCPDVCPTTLADYAKVKGALGDDAAVTFAFVGVDSPRDTPDAVSEYLAQYDADFIGMTGDEATLRRMGQEFGLFFEREAVNVGHEHEEGHEHGSLGSDEAYFIQHTSPSFLIDGDGYLRRVIFYGTASEAIAAEIGELFSLAENS